jgi:hypothetical protein
LAQDNIVFMNATRNGGEKNKSNIMCFKCSKKGYYANERKDNAVDEKTVPFS